MKPKEGRRGRTGEEGKKDKRMGKIYTYSETLMVKKKKK